MAWSSYRRGKCSFCSLLQSHPPSYAGVKTNLTCSLRPFLVLPWRAALPLVAKPWGYLWCPRKKTYRPLVHLMPRANLTLNSWGIFLLISSNVFSISRVACWLGENWGSRIWCLLCRVSAVLWFWWGWWAMGASLRSSPTACCVELWCLLHCKEHGKELWRSWCTHTAPQRFLCWAVLFRLELRG